MRRLALTFGYLLAAFGILNFFWAAFSSGQRKENYAVIQRASYADTVYDALKKGGVVDELMVVAAAQDKEKYDQIIAAIESLVKAGKLVELEPGHSWNGTEFRRWEMRR